MCVFVLLMTVLKVKSQSTRLTEFHSQHPSTTTIGGKDFPIKIVCVRVCACVCCVDYSIDVCVCVSCIDYSTGEQYRRLTEFH